MKRALVTIGVVAIVSALSVGDLIGRGGGGRGGGGGGGRPGGGMARPAAQPAAQPSFSGGAVANRGGGLGAGPSFSPHPAGPAVGQRPAGGPGIGGPGIGGPGVGGPGVGRPNVGAPGVGNIGGGVGNRPGGGAPSRDQLGNFLDINSGPATRPGGGVGSGPSAINDFFQSSPGGVGGPGVGGPGVGKGRGVGGAKGVGQNAANRTVAAHNRPTRVENRQQLAQSRQDRRQDIQHEFHDNHPRFDWAVDHPRWASWRVNAPYRWATAAALTGWCGYGAASYYDYGENIYYQDGGVYTGDQQIATADQYAAAADQIVASIPPTLKEPEWMPLGVFALTQDNQSSGPAPTMFVQLTVSKDGLIAGTFQNTSLGTTQPIEGMVDKKSQRAAWIVSGKSRPLMETGIFNLTKDTCPALMHFEDGQTQQWLMVRMDEPKQ